MTEKKKKRKKTKKRKRVSAPPTSAADLEKKIKKSKGISIYDHGKARLEFANRKQARRHALIDYVTDLEERSIDATYHRVDRNYSEMVTLTRWYEWAAADGWAEYRRLFWQETQIKLIRKMEDRQVDIHVKDIDTISKVQQPLLEWMMPLTDEDGNWIRDEDGLPKFPLELGRMDNVAKLWLALMDKKTALRGDVLHRTDVIARGRREDESPEEKAQGPVRFSENETAAISSLARKILALRDPRLNRVIDTEAEDGSDEDSEENS